MPHCILLVLIDSSYKCCFTPVYERHCFGDPLCKKAVSASPDSAVQHAGDAAALLGAAANGASLSIGRLLLLAPYHVPVFAYSFVVTGAPFAACVRHSYARVAATGLVLMAASRDGSLRALAVLSAFPAQRLGFCSHCREPQHCQALEGYISRATPAILLVCVHLSVHLTGYHYRTRTSMCTLQGPRA